MSDYGTKMMKYFGGANVMNILALARELGVIQLLMDATTPMTSQHVADKLELKERFVREMLSTLAVGEVISIDDTSSLFHVPADNKTTLNAVSTFARFVPLYGERFAAVKECYRKSGPAGVQYTDFPKIFDVLEEVIVSKKDLLDVDILPNVPDIVQKLETGIKVAEFGCSTGTLINKLAARFPNSSFIGGDVAMEPLNEARTKAANQSLQNIKYDIIDLDTLPESYNDRFDWVFIRDVVHDLPHPQKALNGIHQILKPGGFFSLIDIGMSGEAVKEIADPFSMFYYSASCFFCICESYQRADSAAVGAAWGIPLAKKMLTEAGFTIKKENFSQFDPKEIHFACQK